MEHRIGYVGLLYLAYDLSKQFGLSNLGRKTKQNKFPQKEYVHIPK